MTIVRDRLSPYQLENFPETHGCEKIVPNLRNKTKYVLHYSNLKMYLQLDTNDSNIVYSNFND